MKNRAYQEGIKCTPYDAMFGTSMKIGIETLAISKDMIGLIRSEDDWENLLHGKILNKILTSKMLTGQGRQRCWKWVGRGF